MSSSDSLRPKLDIKKIKFSYIRPFVRGEEVVIRVVEATNGESYKCVPLNMKVSGWPR
jgi:hypothetical protein